MGIVTELKDEWQSLADARVYWEKYWREVARYVLPQSQEFDSALSRSPATAINSVVSTPAGARRSKDLYDMTSLWAIERLTAGLISLKTPEAQTWHDVTTDDYFGSTPNQAEKVALERLRNYLFKVRNNPNSGFWGAHRAAVKSMCAFGDGWMFLEELPGRNARLPYRYRYLPLTELYPAVDEAGRPNRMFRIFRWSALQAASYFGSDKVPPSVLRMAQDPTQKHNTVRVMHGVRPRDEMDRRGRIGVMAGGFESHYCFPDDDYHVGEGGFNEFPFMRYAWSNSGNTPFSEGPIAYALGELRSLQEMAKNELIAVQQAIRPAYATAGKNFVKLNLNPGQVNANLVSGDGRPLFAPMNSGVRPDFAQAIMSARRDSIREMLYLNLWQIIVQDKNDTATEALIRAQEKGELLGPVGISLNEGLAMMNDREVAILGRKHAFDDDSPLAMPDSLVGKGVSPVFNSPLDRLRRVSEVVGMQRLVEFAMMLAGGDPQRGQQIMARFDVDEMLELAQEVLGAPAVTLRGRDDANADRSQSDQTQQALLALQSLQGAGQAAQSVGDGLASAAQGAAAAQATPALQDLMTQLPDMAAAGAAAGARQAG